MPDLPMNEDRDFIGCIQTLHARCTAAEDNFSALYTIPGIFWNFFFKVSLWLSCKTQVSNLVSFDTSAKVNWRIAKVSDIARSRNVLYIEPLITDLHTTVGYTDHDLLLFWNDRHPSWLVTFNDVSLTACRKGRVVLVLK